jgi:hypothetical protein
VSRLLVTNDARTVSVEVVVGADKRATAACEAGDWATTKPTDPCSADQFDALVTEASMHVDRAHR